MTGRRRLLVLILIMAVGTLAVAFGAILLLYRAALDEEGNQLQDTVQSEARLIEAVALLGPGDEHLEVGAMEAATIARIVAAHRAFDAFGRTGEFVMAKREGGRIVFLLRHRSVNVETPAPVDFSASFAEPMRRALLGQSGTMVGTDYRGQRVLAAYEPIGVLGLGLVAKIDLAEVQAPFKRAGLLTVAMAMFVVVAGAALFVRVSNPMIRDLEEHSHRLEEIVGALRVSEERYRSTFDRAAVGVAQVDPSDGRFLRVNHRLCEVLGYSDGELLTMRSDDVALPNDLEKDRALVGELITGRRSTFSVERRWRRKDSEEVWVSVTVAPVREGAVEPSYLVAVVEDITERKRVELALKASLREKEVLLREIHHRVKNNMQVVSSLLNLQAEGITDPVVRTIFRESQSRVQAMALIHEVLYGSEDLSSIDLQRYLAALARGLAQMHGDGSKSVRVLVDAGDVALGLDDTVPCGLVINELITNSFKHAFPGGRPGEIRIEAASVDDGRVTLSVRDNGIGMPSDVHVERAATMGLQLVHGLVVNQLGGEVDVNGEGGTCVRISFPRSDWMPERLA